MLPEFAMVVLLLASLPLAWRRHGWPGLKSAALHVALWSGIAGCARPYLSGWRWFALAGALLVLVLTLRPRPARAPARMRVTTAILLVLALGVVVPLGTAELVATKAAKFGWITVFEPTQLQLGPGLSPAAALVHQPDTEDWRLCHIVGDELRELDPVLFWRSKPRAPYNAQRFKGPIAEVPKPPGLRRIIAYGDSNTDGPPDRSPWPEFLAKELGARPDDHGNRWEVLNAAIAGYSSYQGLMRARQEVGTYAPDLIFVSFGWNDLPAALGRPDKDFRPPSAAFVCALDVLARSKLFLWFKHLAAPASPMPSVGQRVNPVDYEHNLDSFLELARQHGIRAVFLTRPHRLVEAQQRAVPGWRGTVPDYNDVVRRFAQRTGATLLDVARRFEGQDDRFFDESHFSELGHLEMARYVHERLVALGLLEFP